MEIVLSILAYYFGQRVAASQWRVWYQRGLPILEEQNAEADLSSSSDDFLPCWLLQGGE